MIPRKRLLFQNTNPIKWIIKDEFATNLVAGAVNGSFAEPAGANRVVVDTANLVSIASGQLNLGGFTSSFDPKLIYSSTPIPRTAGRLILYKVTPANITDNLYVALSQSSNGTAKSGIKFSNGGALTPVQNFAGPVVACAFTTATYIVATLLRASGQMTFIKGGIFTNWTLIYIDSTDNDATVYAVIGKSSGAGVPLIDFVHVPENLWLPAPLASDGFGLTFGVTDGLGQAETSGPGSGGAGLAWTQQIGTFQTSGGVANASALSGGLAIATVSLSTPDVFLSTKLNRSAGVVGNIVRYVDSNNYVYAIHDGTNAKLIKRVAGVETTIINSAKTYSAGAELALWCDGQNFRLFYNNSLVGSESTIADAGLQSGAAVGLYTTDTGNTWDNFRAYARGTSGEYNAYLDQY